ncbi:unnamed protein product [Penicillium salamii]|uniref:GDS1 winged helix domain-containing protein n=1 Tax=Penicillium salamii TaxID=1612424 RepID=A0A9W4NX70_9EURO|nr:unnamed protein product [Penicillium salamii]CAG8193055.1 unnamed protein product [Penicillium salamii]CAG8268394.1 unnamed protein product [Penicillium salamii]CAG8305808.1 unnamed protein product [Penicillium salamii]CAG8360646.1 unnamed protein product [Penicillium salamii]
MPYNTRRKSLSLPSLGIQLPNSSRRSPSLSKAHTEEHPTKKVKRSHGTSLSPEPADKIAARAGRHGLFEHTPPPSPMDGVHAPKIDTEGINDDIVVAVINQLEKTGNRPHLVKELAAVLVALNVNVANSANPAALLSSRLAAYMKRSWTALAPCPIAKELILIHPRKVYYYLTTFPHQSIPETDDVVPAVDGKRITPSVSSLEDEEDAMMRERSPSPEVDLSSPDFEEDLHSSHGTTSEHFPDASNLTRLMHSHRAASPPLEGDEKEFTQTASAVRERASEEKASESSRSQSILSESLSAMEDAGVSEPSVNGGSMSPSLHGDGMSEEEYSDYFSHMPADHMAQDADEAAATALFGTSPSPSLTSIASSVSSGTSLTDAGMDLALAGKPAAPQIALPEDPDAAPVSTLKRSLDMLNSGLPDVDLKMSDLTESHERLTLTPRPVSMSSEPVFDSWRELQNPEMVEVDELDEMFGEI